MKEAHLICMRLRDMKRVHPLQISSHCSKCSSEVGIYPSGQRILRKHPHVKIICQLCMEPADVTMLAPGALDEPAQSRPKQTN